MKKLSFVLVMLLTFSFVAINVVTPTTVHAEESIIDKTGDWFATLGKSDMEKAKIKAERKAKRMKAKAEKEAKKAAKSVEKEAGAMKDKMEKSMDGHDHKGSDHKGSDQKGS